MLFRSGAVGAIAAKKCLPEGIILLAATRIAVAALHDLETSENAWVCDSTDCVGSWKVEHSSIELLRELLE